MKAYTEAKTLNIDAKSFDGSQSAKVKIPLKLIHYGFKLANLLPASAVEKIDQELAKKGVTVSFENLLKEGHEAFFETLKDIEIDVQDKKQSCKLYLS